MIKKKYIKDRRRGIGLQWRGIAQSFTMLLFSFIDSLFFMFSLFLPFRSIN